MNEEKNTLTVPTAIIVAGIIIAGAVFLSTGKSETEEKEKITEKTAKIITVEAITEKDHILGNPGAPVMIIEYGDLECPACKFFHPTMKKTMEQYGKNGDLAWVFRHFPLDSIHSKARKEAEATECAAELGGNAKFWAFVDRLYEVTPGNNGLDLTELPKIASHVGLDNKKFEECLKSGKHAAAVEADFQGGLKAGVAGTPSSFWVINPPLSSSKQKAVERETADIRGRDGKPVVEVSSDGKIVTTPAALPFELIKKILDELLAK